MNFSRDIDYSPFSSIESILTGSRAICYMSGSTGSSSSGSSNYGNNYAAAAGYSTDPSTGYIVNSAPVSVPNYTSSITITPLSSSPSLMQMPVYSTTPMATFSYTPSSGFTQLSSTIGSTSSPSLGTISSVNLGSLPTYASPSMPSITGAGLGLSNLNLGSIANSLFVPSYSSLEPTTPSISPVASTSPFLSGVTSITDPVTGKVHYPETSPLYVKGGVLPSASTSLTVPNIGISINGGDTQMLGGDNSTVNISGSDASTLNKNVAGLLASDPSKVYTIQKNVDPSGRLADTYSIVLNPTIDTSLLNSAIKGSITEMAGRDFALMGKVNPYTGATQYQINIPSSLNMGARQGSIAAGTTVTSLFGVGNSGTGAAWGMKNPLAGYNAQPFGLFSLFPHGSPSFASEGLSPGSSVLGTGQLVDYSNTIPGFSKALGYDSSNIGTLLSPQATDWAINFMGGNAPNSSANVLAANYFRNAAAEARASGDEASYSKLMAEYQKADEAVGTYRYNDLAKYGIPVGNLDMLKASEYLSAANDQVISGNYPSSQTMQDMGYLQRAQGATDIIANISSLPAEEQEQAYKAAVASLRDVYQQGYEWETDKTTGKLVFTKIPDFYKDTTSYNPYSSSFTKPETLPQWTIEANKTPAANYDWKNQGVYAGIPSGRDPLHGGVTVYDSEGNFTPEYLSSLKGTLPGASSKTNPITIPAEVSTKTETTLTTRLANDPTTYSTGNTSTSPTITDTKKPLYTGPVTPSNSAITSIIIKKDGSVEAVRNNGRYYRRDSSGNWTTTNKEGTQTSLCTNNSCEVEDRAYINSIITDLNNVSNSIPISKLTSPSGGGGTMLMPSIPIPNYSAIKSPEEVGPTGGYAGIPSALSAFGKFFGDLFTQTTSSSISSSTSSPQSNFTIPSWVPSWLQEGASTTYASEMTTSRAIEDARNTALGTAGGIVLTGAMITSPFWGPPVVATTPTILGTASKLPGLIVKSGAVATVAKGVADIAVGSTQSIPTNTSSPEQYSLLQKTAADAASKLSTWDKYIDKDTGQFKGLTDSQFTQYQKDYANYKSSTEALNNSSPYGSMASDKGILGLIGKGEDWFNRNTFLGFDPKDNFAGQLGKGILNYYMPTSIMNELYPQKGPISAITLTPGGFGATWGVAALTYKEAPWYSTALNVAAGALPIVGGPASSLFKNIGGNIATKLASSPAGSAILKGASSVSSPFRVIGDVLNNASRLTGLDRWSPYVGAWNLQKVIPGYGKYASAQGWLGPVNTYSEMLKQGDINTNLTSRSSFNIVQPRTVEVPGSGRTATVEVPDSGAIMTPVPKNTVQVGKLGPSRTGPVDLADINFESKAVGGASPTHVVTPDGIAHPYTGTELPSQVSTKIIPTTGKPGYRIGADLVPIRLPSQYQGKAVTLSDSTFKGIRDTFYGQVPHSEVGIYGPVEEAYVKGISVEEQVAQVSRPFETSSLGVSRSSAIPGSSTINSIAGPSTAPSSSSFELSQIGRVSPAFSWKPAINLGIISTIGFTPFAGALTSIPSHQQVSLSIPVGSVPSQSQSYSKAIPKPTISSSQVSTFQPFLQTPLQTTGRSFSTLAVSNPLFSTISQPSQIPVVSPVKSSLLATVDIPVNTPIQNTVVKPIVSPIQSLVQDTLQTPVQNPIQNLVQDPITSPIQTPVFNTIQNPVQMPITGPIGNPAINPSTGLPLLPIAGAGGLGMTGGGGGGGGGLRSLLSGKSWNIPIMSVNFSDPFTGKKIKKRLYKGKDLSYGATESPRLSASKIKG